MATPVKISQLPAAGPIMGTEFVAIVQGGLTVKTTVVDITNGLVGPPGPAGGPGPPGPPGGFALGTVVAPPIPNSILGTDALSQTCQVPALTWNGALGFGLASGAFTVLFADTSGTNNNTAVFMGPGGSVSVLDGARGIQVACNGYLLDIAAAGVAFSYVTSNPAWSFPFPNDVWAALDRLANVVTALWGAPIP